MSRWCGLALLAALALAAALRLPGLDVRPFHNDEGVNAVKVTDLWLHGRYAYDPDEYHGPTLIYACLPFLRLGNATDPGQWDDALLRYPTVVFGIGVLLLFPLLADGLGWRATAWAALFAAVSPAMVFYSRYFIHEMLLVFFSVLALGSGWRYVRRPAGGWAVLTGMAVGWMFATKETFVLTLGAAAMAMGVALVRDPRRTWAQLAGPGGILDLRTALRRLPWGHMGWCVAGFGLVWLVFFSSFFTHMEGLADSIRTYLPWLKRAGGASPHVHPWHFYLSRLLWFHPGKGPYWSEGAIVVLAVVGGCVSMGSWRLTTSPGDGERTGLGRFITITTLVLTGVYSAISYKTPWCMLSFLTGMILMAGIGAAALVGSFKSRVARVGVTCLLASQLVLLGWQARRASLPYASDRRNPYVYAQTVPDLLGLAARAEGVARVAAAGFATPVKVMAPRSDYWPLPWYLRKFRNVGWYDSVPSDVFAPIIVVSSQFDARLDDRSGRKWVMAGISELRPGQFFELYVELELWKQYVATLPRERD